MSPSSGLVRAVGALVMLGCLSSAGTIHAAADTPPRQDTPAERIRTALDQPVSLEITSKDPLGQLLAFLRDKAKITVTVDHAEFARVLQAVNRESVETLDFPQKHEKVRLGTAVRSILRPYNLTWVIADNSLVITSPEMASRWQLQQRVSVDFSDVPLKSALRYLSRRTAVNVIIDPRLNGTDNLNNVSLNAEDVPLETAARLVAEVAGLKAVAVGNVIFVTTESRANKLRAEQCGSQPDRYPALPATRPLLPPIHTPGEKKTPPEP